MRHPEKRRAQRILLSSVALCAFSEHSLALLSHEPLEGEGTLQDLTIYGCRITIPSSFPPRSTLTLILQLSTHMKPIPISLARVVWQRDDQHGLEFLSLAGEADTALRAFLLEQ